MAGEEIFTANAILTVAFVGVFLALYALHREKNQIFSDAALLGVFASLIFGSRVGLRAFKAVDPLGGMDTIIDVFLQVFLWLLIAGTVALFIRLMITILRGVSTGRWEGWEKLE